MTCAISMCPHDGGGSIVTVRSGFAGRSRNGGIAVVAGAEVPTVTDGQGSVRMFACHLCETSLVAAYRRDSPACRVPVGVPV